MRLPQFTATESHPLQVDMQQMARLILRQIEAEMLEIDDALSTSPWHPGPDARVIGMLRQRRARLERCVNVLCHGVIYPRSGSNRA